MSRNAKSDEVDAMAACMQVNERKKSEVRTRRAYEGPARPSADQSSNNKCFTVARGTRSKNKWLQKCV